MYFGNNGSVGELRFGLRLRWIVWLAVPATQRELETVVADYDL